MLSCIIPGAHYTAWHILFKLRGPFFSDTSPCLFARVRFFSHELRQNASFSSFAADNSVYCIAQQEDVTKEESGGVGPVIEMRLDGTYLSLNTDSYHQRKHGNSAFGSYHLAFEFLQSEMLELF